MPVSLGGVYEDTLEDAVHFRGMQVGRYTHAYTAMVLVPVDGNTIAAALPSPSSRARRATLQIEETSEFHITHISASVLAPVSAPNTGRRDTLFPLFAMAGVTSERSDRGVVFRILDGKDHKHLTLGQTRTSGPNVMAPASPSLSAYWAAEGYIPLEAVFPPCYGTLFQAPVPWEYHIERNGRLLIDLLNRDLLETETPGDRAGFHRVSLLFLGQHYDA